MASKPEGWLGTCDEQKELFVEILANLSANEILDRNRRCMSFESFSSQALSLMWEEKYYDKAVKYFSDFITAWRVAYSKETGIIDRELADANLSRKLYVAYILSVRPGKIGKYQKVYEDLARDK
jgi:hypothetical protein